jgi:D-alanine-D-alanine ligase
MKSLNVAVLANLKINAPPAIGKNSDIWMELDSETTINTIIEALESEGHRATFIEANLDIVNVLPKLKPDICFNIAEGHFGDSRTAQVPALLDMLRIPYTGSGVLAQSRGLNKRMTKVVWLAFGLPTTEYVEANSEEDLEDQDFNYPLFVKPVREGTGMGVSASSIVNNFSELKRKVSELVAEFDEPALIEPFLSGNEYTVGVIGNKPEQYVFPPIEIEVDFLSDEKGVYGAALKTTDKVMKPAHLEPSFITTLRELALDAHNVLGANDVSRVDIRCDENNQPFLLEINLTPGLVKGFSDLAVAAETVKSYEWLINTILYLGCQRYGIETPPIEFPDES